MGAVDSGAQGKHRVSGRTRFTATASQIAGQNSDPADECFITLDEAFRRGFLSLFLFKRLNMVSHAFENHFIMYLLKACVYFK